MTRRCCYQSLTKTQVASIKVSPSRKYESMKVWKFHWVVTSLSALQLPNGVDQTEEGGTKSSLSRFFRSEVACVVSLFVVFLQDHRSHIEGEIGKRLRWMVRAWSLSFPGNTSIDDVSFPDYSFYFCGNRNYALTRAFIDLISFRKAWSIWGSELMTLTQTRHQGHRLPVPLQQRLSSMWTP